MHAQLSAPLVSAVVNEAGCTISVKRTGPKAQLAQVGAPTLQLSSEARRSALMCCSIFITSRKAAGQSKQDTDPVEAQIVKDDLTGDLLYNTGQQ
jgi:hypothetical protein